MKPGNKLRIARLSLFITLEDVYIKSRRKISTSKLSRIERGITIPTEKEKRIISRILKVPIEDLFD